MSKSWRVVKMNAKGDQQPRYVQIEIPSGTDKDIQELIADNVARVLMCEVDEIGSTPYPTSTIRNRGEGMPDFPGFCATPWKCFNMASCPRIPSCAD